MPTPGNARKITPGKSRMNREGSRQPRQLKVVDGEHTANPAYLSNARLEADWLRHHHADWAEGTVRVRRAALRRFADYLAPTPLVQATEKDCLAWRDSRALSAEAVAGKVATLKSFFGYLVLRRIREDDPSREVEAPKRIRWETQDPDYVTEEELERVIRFVQPDRETLAMVLLMAYSGFRASDVAWLTVAGIKERDGKGAWARVVGKGRKARSVPIPAVTMDVLRPFLHGGGPVFTRARSGTAYKPENVSKRIRGVFAEVRPAIDKRPHALRHRFAKRFAEVEPDIRVLQKILGHADPATTMVYSHTDPGLGAVGVDALAARTSERHHRKQQMRGAAS
jgi:integrase/recombinase XerD